MVNSELFPFKSHFLNIGPHRIHYIDEGAGSGKPVLLMVHGNPTWSFYYRNLIKHFRKNYRVVAIDHMGCGLSDKPQTYAYVLSEHIRNLTSLIDHLQLKNMTLFVHDWGGAIGMGYAVENPHHVRGFVIFNTAAFKSKRIPLRIAACRIPVVGKFMIQRLNGFARAATLMATRKGLSSDVKQGLLAPYNTYANRIATYQFVQDIPMHEDHTSWDTLTDIENKLTKLSSHPMSIFWGGKDFCFNDSFLRTWQNKFPKADLHYFKEAGHYVVEDAHEQIIPLVDTFLNRIAHA